MSTKLKDIMTRNVEVIKPDDSLRDAAQKMRSHDIGFLPVCDGERIIGTLSDRDITVLATAEGKDPKKTKVKDVARTDVYWCFDDQDVNDAAKIMQEKQVRRLVVIDHHDKKLAGIVSLGDLATKSSSKMSGNVLEKVGPH